MRYNREILWSEGMFLQQQHLQYLQNFFLRRSRQERGLFMPFPYGLLEIELDESALENRQVSLHRVVAIMKEGDEICMPGNTVIPPLNLQPYLKNKTEPFLVYLGLPRYSTVDANLSENGAITEMRQYTAEELAIPDENSGQDEVEVSEKRLMVRLVPEGEDRPELLLLPILRLIPVSDKIADVSVQLDHTYLPPILLLNGGHPLFSKLQDIVEQIRLRRDKILNDLTVLGYNPALFGGSGHDVLQLSILNKYLALLSSQLLPSHSTPYDIYQTLRTMQAELSALQPLRDQESVPEYNHDDCAPQFNELLFLLRALLLASNDANFTRIDFEQQTDGTGLGLKLSDDIVFHADEYYLAVQAQAQVRDIVRAAESGDNFRLISPLSSAWRIRGLKQTEQRYPPRYFPALPDTVWFKLEKDDTSPVWRAIKEERALALDYAQSLFPKLTASLFITIETQGEKRNE